MCKYLIRVCNCLHYQVRHFYDISRQEITLPKFYGVHVANNDVLHPPCPNMKGKQLRSMYIYLPRLVAFTENAVYWKFLFILYFLLSFYIYHFFV